jgi:hypothetical protein
MVAGPWKFMFLCSESHLSTMKKQSMLKPILNATSALVFLTSALAAWTADHRTLTVAVLNPTDVEQPLKLNIAGADLSGTGTLWRLASTESDGQNPTISSVLVGSVPSSVTLPRFSINIYVLELK